MLFVVIRSIHSIRAVATVATLALLALLAAQTSVDASEQQPIIAPALQEAGAFTFTTFLRGAPIGTEQVALTRIADGWTIAGTGRLGAPLDIVGRRVQVRYTADWRPVELTFDATVRGQAQTIRTTVQGTTATSTIRTGGQTTEKTDTIDAAAVLILPGGFFSPYEALAARLRSAAPGTDIPIYSVPGVSFTGRVGESTPEQIQTTARVIAARRTRVTLALPGAPVEITIWSDETGRMIRLSAPGQSLEVVREDIAAVSSRTVTISRPNDERVSIPSNGFSLAGTASRPVSAAGKLPAVVLVGASGPTDRDGLAFGVPILGELAGAIADAGFLVVRYDKRGIGQSGGRWESAGLLDYAEDVRAAIKMLERRKDVDAKRIAVIGHSEGGTVALTAASKDKRIGAVAVLGAPGVTGADIVLAQQQRLLNRSALSAEDKQKRIDAQKRIHDAVISGKGLELLAPDVRRAVDNVEYQTLLVADPAKILADVRQPLLIVQGDLDTQVEPPNADRLEALARARKNAKPVEVVKIPGVNHLLMPAATGEVDEYPTLKDKHVSPAVTQAIVTWLKKTLSAAP
jgi:pimeloyl-ACP methyl ester carboxylesterase